MTRSVLVVDDDPAFRGLAVRMLTAAGLEVVAQACLLYTSDAADEL